MHVDFHIPNLLKQFITLTLYFCRSLLPVQENYLPDDVTFFPTSFLILLHNVLANNLLDRKDDIVVVLLVKS